MLGFSALSQTAFSEATTSLDAIVTITATVASAVNSAVEVDAKAHIACDSVSSSTTASSLDYVAIASITTGTVSSQVVASDFADVDAQANITATAITAVIAAYDFSDVDAQSNITLNSVASTITVYGLSDVDAQANITADVVTVVTAIEALDSVDAQANYVVTGVASSFVIDNLADVDARASIVVSANNVMQLSFGKAVDAFDADANVTLEAATAVASVTAIEDVHLTANPVVSSTTASIVNNAFTDVDAKATIVVTANNLMQLSFGKAVDAYDADANVTLQAVTAVASVTAIDVHITANPVVSSTTASIVNSVFTDVVARATIAVTANNLMRLSFGKAVDAYDADANVTIQSVTAIGEIELFTYKIDVKTTASSVSASIVDSAVTTNVINTFPYGNFAEDYSRNRLIYVSAFDKNKQVYVTPMNFSVVIQPDHRDNFVYIAA